MKITTKNIYKITFTLEVILFVAIIVLLKLIPVTINSVFVFITLFCCKVLIDNVINRVFAIDKDYQEIMNTPKINLKNSKKYYLFSGIILLIIFTYYILSIVCYYNLASKDKINDILSKNCKIDLITENNNVKYFSNENNDSCKYNIYLIETAEKNNNIFNNYINVVVNENQPINNSDKITSWDGIEWSAEGKTYSIIYQKRNTIVYINSHIKYKEEVKNIMKKIGYTSESTSKHIFK